MGRWQPDARGRLLAAALELYGERGYEQTTVAEIAARAGLTERTFFRHFPDKREVLFSGSGALQEAMVGALESAPEGVTPIDAIAVALDAGARVVPGRVEYARRRQQIIAANAELGERERIKLASLAAGMAGALRRRGVADHVAMLAAETGVAVFRVSFERWLDEQNTRDFAELLRDSLEELKAVAAGRQ